MSDRSTTIVTAHPVSDAALAAFQEGHAAGQDPDTVVRLDEHADDAPRIVTTTLRSSWLHEICRSCAHTFRPGDKVAIQKGCRPVHQMAGLGCAGGVTTLPTGGAERSDFFDGLGSAWRIPHDVPIIRLESDHPLVAPPAPGFPRYTCRVCGHTLRELDHVVLCPCSPAAPICAVAVHRDIFRQLHCWDEWNRGDHRGQCLAVS